MSEADPFEDGENDITPFPDRSSEDQKEQDIISDDTPSSPRRKATVIERLAEDIDIVEVSQIVVCEPQEKKDSKTGLIKWTEYKIITEKSDGSQAEVFRRYNHFLWLRKLIWQEYRGIIVPPLPEKKNFGRFDASFVERRRRRLEQFLNRLATHPYLKDSNTFHVFLNIQESETFAQAIQGDQKTVGEKYESLYNSYRKTKQKLLKNPAGESEDDQECTKIKAYGKKLETVARDMESQFLTLDNDCRSVGLVWESTATCLGAIADFEKEEGNERAAFCLSALQETCDKVGALNKDPESLSTFTTIKLRDLFDDFSKYGKSVKECVDGRDDLWYRHQAEISTLESRKKTLHGLETGSYVYNKDSRVAATKSQITESETKVAELSEELNSVTDRLQTEVRAFQKVKPSRIEDKLLAFADFQIEHMEAMVKYWKNLKEKLTE